MRKQAVAKEGEVRSIESKKVLHGYTEEVQILEFSSDEKQLLVGKSNKGIDLFGVLENGLTEAPIISIPTGKLVDIRARPQVGNEFIILEQSGELSLGRTDDIAKSLISKDVTSACWSPLGTQILAGLKNKQIAKLSISSGELKRADITPPDDSLVTEGNYIPISINSIRSKQFIVTYREVPENTNEDEEVDPLHAFITYLVSHDSETHTYTWSEVEDPCPPFADMSREGWRYTQVLNVWSEQVPDLITLACGPSSDIGLLTTKEIFEMSEDRDRASLPFTEDDTTPIGFVLDFSSEDRVLDPCLGVDDCVALPIIWALNNEGTISGWHIVWIKGIKSLGEELSLKNIQNKHSSYVSAAFKNRSKGPLPKFHKDELKKSKKHKEDKHNEEKGSKNEKKDAESSPGKKEDKHHKEKESKKEKKDVESSPGKKEEKEKKKNLEIAVEPTEGVLERKPEESKESELDSKLVENKTKELKKEKLDLSTQTVNVPSKKSLVDAAKPERDDSKDLKVNFEAKEESVTQKQEPALENTTDKQPEINEREDSKNLEVNSEVKEESVSRMQEPALEKTADKQPEIKKPAKKEDSEKIKESSDPRIREPATKAEAIEIQDPKKITPPSKISTDWGSFSSEPPSGSVIGSHGMGIMPRTSFGAFGNLKAGFAFGQGSAVDSTDSSTTHVADQDESYSTGVNTLPPTPQESEIKQDDIPSSDEPETKQENAQTVKENPFSTTKPFGDLSNNSEKNTTDVENKSKSKSNAPTFGFSSFNNSPSFGTSSPTASPFAGLSKPAFSSLSNASPFASMANSKLTSGETSTVASPFTSLSNAATGSSIFDQPDVTAEDKQEGSIFGGGSGTSSFPVPSTEIKSVFGATAESKSVFGDANSIAGISNSGFTFNSTFESKPTFEEPSGTKSVFGDTTSVPGISNSGFSLGSTFDSKSNANIKSPFLRSNIAANSSTFEMTGLTSSIGSTLPTGNFGNIEREATPEKGFGGFISTSQSFANSSSLFGDLNRTTQPKPEVVATFKPRERPESESEAESERYSDSESDEEQQKAEPRALEPKVPTESKTDAHSESVVESEATLETHHTVEDQLAPEVSINKDGQQPEFNIDESELLADKSHSNESESPVVVSSEDVPTAESFELVTTEAGESEESEEFEESSEFEGLEDDLEDEEEEGGISELSEEEQEDEEIDPEYEPLIDGMDELDLGDLTPPTLNDYIPFEAEIDLPEDVSIAVKIEYLDPQLFTNIKQASDFDIIYAETVTQFKIVSISDLII